jgi:exodeoxyribonuclease VII small subunit
MIMAKERELDERLDRVEAIIEQLEVGDPSREEDKRLFEEGSQTLDEFRDIRDRGAAEVVELPE